MNAVTGQENGANGGAGVGSSIASMEARTLDGESVSLSDYVGKKVILDFWATWCGPCVQQRSIFAGLGESFHDEVTIIALSVDENPAVVQSFIDRQGSDGVELMDTGILSAKFDVSKIPTLVFVDSTGTVQQIKRSMLGPDELKRIVSTLD